MAAHVAGRAPRRRLHRWLLGMCLGLCCGPVALATSLQVAPTRIAINADEGAGGLQVSNSGTEPIHVQVRVFRWWQEGGEDMLEATDALVVSPPMLQLAPGAEQLVRIVHTGAAPSDGEATYRVIVDELPLQGAQRPGVGLRFALRYSIPVFVHGTAVASPEGVLHAQVRNGPEGAVVEIHNAGDGTAQLADLSMVDAAGRAHVIAEGLSGYVMPGQTRQWPLPAGTPPTGRIEAKLNGEPQARALAPDR